MISGGRDAGGGLPTIAGGEWPFLVDAVDAHVTIEGLRFVRPKAGAIWVYAVAGLAVTGCRVESIEPTVEFAMQSGQANPVSTAIFVGSDPHPGAAAQPQRPGNFSGTLAILNNDIDVNGARGNQALGIVMFSAGRSPDKEVDIYVSANNIRNTTEPAINLRYIVGRAHVERNVLTTGALTLGASDAIRIAGSGSYLIAHNSVDCGWADGAAVGINVFGLSAAPEASAIVMDNDVTMSAPEGTVFGPNSAGIEIKAFAKGNSVLNNRIRGRASAALSVIGQNGGIPGNSSFVSNDLDGFQSSLADVFVDAGATNTVFIGRQARVENRGIGTVVVPMP